MQYLSASFSPDGKWMTVSRTPGSGKKGNADVYVMRADGTGLRQVTRDAGMGQLDRLGVTMKALVSILAIAALGALLAGASLGRPGCRALHLGSGTLAIASNRDGNAEIYLMTESGRILRRLTNDPKFDGAPAWSPDGRRIAFYSQRTPNGDVFVVNTNGTGLLEPDQERGPRRSRLMVA